ncbi:MAG: glycosyl transferase family 11, partial [Frankiales bacterium]|nr:glycosyl transferase family 11 [Frankiales bacterium]
AFPIRAMVLDGTVRAAGETRRLPVVKERGFHFQPGLLTVAPSCYLEGYWQSERYFEVAAEDIRRDFRVEPSPDADPLRSTDPEKAVSVHVRRGDYVAEPEIRAYHGTCSLEYYARAMDLVRRLVPGAKFLLFSDDPLWVEANLGGPDAVVVSEPGSAPHRDLLLMAQCRHHVLANSSFSWWGAWLSRPGGVTVAPRPWFLTPENNTKDLLPPAWLSVGG